MELHEPLPYPIPLEPEMCPLSIFETELDKPPYEALVFPSL